MKKDNFHLFYRLIAPKKRFFWGLVFIIVLSVLMEGFSFALIIPFFEVFLGTSSNSELSLMLKRLFGFLGIPMTIEAVSFVFFILILSKNIVIVLREAMRTSFAQGFQRDWIDAILKNYLSMSYENFSKEKHGKLADIVLSESIKGSVGLLQLLEYITGIITIPLFVLILYWANPNLTIGGMVVGGILGLLSKKGLANYSKRVGDKELGLRQQVSAEVIEKLGAMRHLRTFGMEDKFRAEIYKKTDDLKKLIVGWEVYTTSSGPIMETLLVLGMVCYLVYSVNVHGLAYFKDLLPVLSMMLIVTHKVLGRVSRVFINRMVVIRYVPSFQTILDNTGHGLAKVDNEIGTKFVSLKNQLRFENVGFSFGQNQVLKNLNFTIGKNEKVAIIGNSGSGKSTVADLLLNLYRPTEGQITVDGTDVGTFSINSWRSKLGFVGQDLFLFHDTIHANVLLGKPDSTTEEIIAACKKAGAHEFISNFPSGYQTIVGDRGAQLSGGQRQRIAIARALIRKPELLVLDEATSALDAETEEQINAEIAHNMKDLAVVIITHREGILKYADKILRLDDGGAREEKFTR